MDVKKQYSLVFWGHTLYGGDGGEARFIYAENKLKSLPTENSISHRKERERLQRQTIRLTKQDIDMIKELMNTMGVMYIEAPYEAD